MYIKYQSGVPVAVVESEPVSPTYRSVRDASTEDLRKIGYDLAVMISRGWDHVEVAHRMVRDGKVTGRALREAGEQCWSTIAKAAQQVGEELERRGF